MTEKLDLRIVKTHKTIRAALIELLDEKPFDKITVQDILERALVNRSTFYKHYSGKSDLAGKMIADFKAEYGDLVRQRFDEVDLPNWFELMSKAQQRWSKTLLALWKIETRRHHLYRDMFEMIQQNFTRLAQSKNITGDIAFQSHMFATLALTNIKYHLENGIPVNIANIQRNIQSMLSVVLLVKA